MDARNVETASGALASALILTLNWLQKCAIYQEKDINNNLTAYSACGHILNIWLHVYTYGIIRLPGFREVPSPPTTKKKSCATGAEQAYI